MQFRLVEKNLEYLVALACFVLYCLTATSYPSLEDANEFVLTSLFWGINHPPGYPLFTILGKLSMLLPFGTAAFKVHVLNAFLAAICLIFVFKVIHKLTQCRWSALFATFFLGFAPTFWSNAITAEIYVLNALFFSILFYTAILFRDEPSKKTLILFSFILGLSLTNHWPLILLTGLCFLVLFWSGKKELLRYSPICILFFVLGLSPYFYLFFAHYLSDFLFSGPIQSFSEFWYHVTRSEYSGFDISTYATYRDFISFLSLTLVFFIQQFLFVGFVFAVLGLVALWKRRAIFWGIVLGISSSTLILMIFRRSEYTLLSKEYHITYQVIPLLLCTVLLGIGIKFARDWLKEQARWQRPFSWSMAAMLMLSGLRVYSKIDTYHDNFAFEYAKLVLENIPQESVLFVKTDSEAGPIAYAHFAQKIRPDLEVISQVSALLPTKIFDRRQDTQTGQHVQKLADFIRQKLSGGTRVFTTERMAYFDDESTLFPFIYNAYGPFFEISIKKKPVHIAKKLEEEAVKFLDRYCRGELSTRWLYHRRKLIGGLCHLVLIQGRNHPILESEPTCKMIKAQFLFVNHQDYKRADRYYIMLLHDTRNASFETRSQIYKEYLVNRVRLLQQLRASKKEMLAQYQRLVDVTLSFLKRYPYCKNKAALNTFQIALQLPVKMDWNFYNQSFARCAWAQKLKLDSKTSNYEIRTRRR